MSRGSFSSPSSGNRCGPVRVNNQAPDFLREILRIPGNSQKSGHSVFHKGRHPADCSSHHRSTYHLGFAYTVRTVVHIGRMDIYGCRNKFRSNVLCPSYPGSHHTALFCIDSRKILIERQIHIAEYFPFEPQSVA